MTKFWIVAKVSSMSGTIVRLAKTAKLHATEESAREEAVRLIQQNQGTAFAVLGAEGVVEATAPPTRYTRVEEER